MVVSPRGLPVGSSVGTPLESTEGLLETVSSVLQHEHGQQPQWENEVLEKL